MKNFEVQHTIRLYDPELIAEIGRTYDAHRNEFRNKNEFLTELLRLGVKAMNFVPPTSPAGAAVPPAAALDKLFDEVKKIEALAEETGKFVNMQGRKMEVHIAVIERLLSSVYNMELGAASGEPVIKKKVEDGFFDNLPMRFEKLILTLEQHFGVK